MGILKKLFGGADGIREAMRESYDRHVRLCPAHSADSPHRLGLFGALASPYRVRLKQPPELAVWAELAPFLGMRESEGVHWLAEYVVYQEMPNEADATGLSAAIDRVFEPAIVDRELRSLAAIAYRERVPWRGLLGSRSMIVLRNAANAVEDEKS